VIGLTHNFFSIINWVDDVIAQLDDVTILVKKRIFFLLHRLFITSSKYSARFDI